MELVEFLLLLVLLLAISLPIRQRHQRHARQGLSSFHPALQTRRRHGVAIGGDGEAVGLDEERGLLGIPLGVWVLFEEGDDGVMIGMVLSKNK